MQVHHLDQALKAQGIPIHGVNSNGVIHFTDEATDEHISQGNAWIQEHLNDPDPAPIPGPVSSIKLKIALMEANLINTVNNSQKVLNN